MITLALLLIITLVGLKLAGKLNLKWRWIGLLAVIPLVILLGMLGIFSLVSEMANA